MPQSLLNQSPGDLRGPALLDDPARCKRRAFSEDERLKLGFTGISHDMWVP